MSDENAGVERLDTTRPLRGGEALERLLRFVHTTNPRNETDWIEWKQGLDLSGPSGRYAVARAILGFANRSPLAARRHVGGLAYLVVGLEPGSAGGQTPVDNATLTQGLRPYLGSQGPAWMPWWGQLDGVEVLVITVEAPEDGHPIHTLKRTYKDTPEGTIFVRHPGVTDRATPADIEMLSARLLAVQGRLELDVTTPGSLCVLDTSSQALGDWLDMEADALMRPLQQAQMNQMADGQRRRLPVDLSRFEDMTRAAERSLESIMGRTVAEDRLPDMYTDEVEAYLAEARERVVPTAMFLFFDADPCPFVIEVTNSTDRNFAKVRLELTFDADVRLDVDDLDPGMPKPPRKWGPRREGGLGLENLDSSPAFYLPSIAPLVTPNYDLDHTIDGTTVWYWVGHLRPRATYRSTPLPVLLGADVGSSVVARWSATSTELDGVLEGELEIPVTGRLALEDLIPHS